MKYLNPFHKESSERKMKRIAERKKLSLKADEEAKKHFEMHKKLAELYPSANGEN